MPVARTRAGARGRQIVFLAAAGMAVLVLSTCAYESHSGWRLQLVPVPAAGGRAAGRGGRTSPPRTSRGRPGPCRSVLASPKCPPFSKWDTDGDGAPTSRIICPPRRARVYAAATQP